MKKLLILAAALLLLALPALAETDLPDDLTTIEASAFEGASLSGVVTLPGSVTQIGSRAFARTGIHGLILPANCATADGSLLAGGSAAYVYLKGSTAVTGSLADVPLVFAPAGSPASGLTGWVDTADLLLLDGWYYDISGETAVPLCLAAPADAASVRLPKLADGKPVTDLSRLTLRGLGSAQLQVPSCAELPDGMTAETYVALTAEAPVCSVDELTAGESATWTTGIANAWGEVTYIWLFTFGDESVSQITAVPTITYAPAFDGECIVSVTVMDELGEEVTAEAAPVTVSPAKPVYRAVLIGNTYPDDESMTLPGCDTDVMAMRAMLTSMEETPFSCTSVYNATKNQTRSAIASAFADAKPTDVSLFFFSGHGADVGALVPTDFDGYADTCIFPSDLRSWLDQIPGTKIVLLDSCHSGSFISKADGASAFSPSAFNSAFISAFSWVSKDADLTGSNYIVLTACTSAQTSQSLMAGDVSFGAFTYGVCYGSGYDEWNSCFLGSMPADVNSDSRITLGECYDVVEDKIAWFATMVPDVKQSTQYFGDTSYVLWID